MRAVILLALLTPFAARAHYFAFEFVTPSGIGIRTDGGVAGIQWIDGPDPTDLAELTLYAARNGLSPFRNAPQDVQFGPEGIPVSDPANVVAWDARAVPPGCYQPFAVMQDRVEGTTIRRCAGLITVGPIDGGNAPPAIWVLNPEFEKPPLDGGSFALRLKVEDPDDVGAVTVRWSDGVDAGGTIVQGLPTSDGGGTLTYAFNPRGLPAASVYYLEAEISGFDGQRCTVWWGGNLPGKAAPDAGKPDAGVEDAGVVADGGGTVAPPSGCGCAQAGSPWLLLGAVGVLLGRRARSGLTGGGRCC